MTYKSPADPAPQEFGELLWHGALRIAVFVITALITSTAFWLNRIPQCLQ